VLVLYKAILEERASGEGVQQEVRDILQALLGVGSDHHWFQKLPEPN